MYLSLKAILGQKKSVKFSGSFLKYINTKERSRVLSSNASLMVVIGLFMGTIPIITCLSLIKRILNKICETDRLLIYLQLIGFLFD
jgi:hypothetical protein